MIDARTAAIGRRHREGASNKQIAQEFGIPPNVAALLVYTAVRSMAPELAERDAVVAARYRAGVPNRAIARELGISLGLVDAAIARTGVARGRPSGRRGPRPGIAARNQQIVALYRKGWSHKKIMRALGVSANAVKYAVRLARGA